MEEPKRLSKRARSALERILNGECQLTERDAEALEKLLRKWGNFG